MCNGILKTWIQDSQSLLQNLVTGVILNYFLKFLKSVPMSINRCWEARLTIPSNVPPGTFRAPPSRLTHIHPEGPCNSWVRLSCLPLGMWYLRPMVTGQKI